MPWQAPKLAVLLAQANGFIDPPRRSRDTPR